MLNKKFPVIFSEKRCELRGTLMPKYEYPCMFLKLNKGYFFIIFQIFSWSARQDFVWKRGRTISMMIFLAFSCTAFGRYVVSPSASYAKTLFHCLNFQISQFHGNEATQVFQTFYGIFNAEVYHLWCFSVMTGAIFLNWRIFTNRR